MIRRATPDDVVVIVELIHELADYERAANECTVTVEQLHERLFGAAPAVFAHVAVVDGEVVATAVWFLSFSTWDGVHGIYLEDLYVRPTHRGAGHGKALIAALARECVERSYSRLTWAVLNWNAPSIEFYDALGADSQDEWTTYRLSGAALGELGRSAP